MQYREWSFGGLKLFAAFPFHEHSISHWACPPPAAAALSPLTLTAAWGEGPVPVSRRILEDQQDSTSQSQWGSEAKWCSTCLDLPHQKLLLITVSNTSFTFPPPSPPRSSSPPQSPPLPIITVVIVTYHLLSVRSGTGIDIKPFIFWIPTTTLYCLYHYFLHFVDEETRLWEVTALAPCYWPTLGSNSLSFSHAMCFMFCPTD